MGLVLSQKRPQRAPCPPPRHVRTQRGDGSYDLTATSNLHLPLDFSASRAVRGKSLLFVSHPVCDTLSQEPDWTKTTTNCDLVPTRPEPDLHRHLYPNSSGTHTPGPGK